jgi:hypothetical protein
VAIGFEAGAVVGHAAVDLDAVTADCPILACFMHCPAPDRSQPRTSDRTCRRPDQFHSPGSLIGLVLSLRVVVLQFWPNWMMIPVVPGIFVTGPSIAVYALATYLIASRVHLNPVWVMFAIAASGYLFGFVGLFIAVPLAAAIAVVVRFAMRQYLESLLKPTAAPPTVVNAPEPSGKKTSFWRRWREKT